jgi:hypothetical protein
MGLPSLWLTRLFALLRPVGGLTLNPPLPATHVKGRARPLSTDLGLDSRHRADLRSASPLATCDLVSQLPLRVHADHRLAFGHIGLGGVVQVLELGVAVGVAG